MAFEDVLSLLDMNLLNVGLLILYISSHTAASTTRVPLVDRLISGGQVDWDRSTSREYISLWMHSIGSFSGAYGDTNLKEATPLWHTLQMVRSLIKSEAWKIQTPEENNSDKSSEDTTDEGESDTNRARDETLQERATKLNNNSLHDPFTVPQYDEQPRGPRPVDNPQTFWPSSLLARSMYALSAAANVSLLLTDATISLKVIKRHLWSVLWVPDVAYERTDALFAYPRLSLSKAFSCIVMLETGDLMVPPSKLKNAFAVSIRNTIYATASLFADPYTYCPPDELRMVIGNVGRPGVSVLIPPANPVLRRPKLESWRLINHEPFTAGNKCEDMFGETSLHLSFTGYEQSVLDSVGYGVQDLEACYLETVITVSTEE